MDKLEKLFKKYDTRLNKISAVFSYKSHGTIEHDEVYQECAVKLIELYHRYRDKPEIEFSKLVNYSLHSLGCKLLRDRFKYIYMSFEDDSGFPQDTERVVDLEVAVPSFLYFYREAALRLLFNPKTRDIFDWLVDNPEVVEEIRLERNLIKFRHRRVALLDIRNAVMSHFGLGRPQTVAHLKRIKDVLKQIWEVEYGIA